MNLSKGVNIRELKKKKGEETKTLKRIHQIFIKLKSWRSDNWPRGADTLPGYCGGGDQVEVSWFSAQTSKKIRPREHKLLWRESKWWGWKERVREQYVSPSLDTPPAYMLSHICALVPEPRRLLFLPPHLFFKEVQWHQRERLIKYWHLDATLMKSPNEKSCPCTKSFWVALKYR